MVTFLTALAMFNTLAVTGPTGVSASVNNITNSVIVNVGTINYSTTSTISYLVVESDVADDGYNDVYTHDMVQLDLAVRTAPAFDDSNQKRITFTFDNAGLSSFNVLSQAVLYDTLTESYYYYPLDSQTVDFKIFVSSNSSYNLYLSFNIYSRDANYSYDNGYNNGYIDGYNTGLDEGTSTGYTNGYAEGLNNSNYTFTQLFASIADTPILMFRRLFNFDLFGTSLITIFLSLFTALIVFGLIKRFFK